MVRERERERERKRKIQIKKYGNNESSKRQRQSEIGREIKRVKRYIERQRDRGSGREKRQ
jgi:hypothetical protein